MLCIMGTQQSTVADSIDRFVWLAVEVFIESVSMVVSWSGRRGTLVGTIGAHRRGVALLGRDGDNDFTTISVKLHLPDSVNFIS